ncbi:hypothetical protein D1872_337640 [compost metagenome]
MNIARFKPRTRQLNLALTSRHMCFPRNFLTHGLIVQGQGEERLPMLTQRSELLRISSFIEDHGNIAIRLDWRL